MKKKNIKKEDGMVEDQPELKKTGKKVDYFYAVGRRKTATARVRLYLKPGPIVVNDKPIEQYFPLETQKRTYFAPFRITDTLEKYSANIRVNGSGKTGQLGAVVHGLARALAFADREKFRPQLKKYSFLTRDQRMKERRKFGLAHKARAKKQSPKR